MTQWGLDNLFNPGKRHMDDEKRRLQSTREEIGDAAGGRRIDLESGTVSISRGPASTTTSVSDDTALDAAPEAEDVPAVALAGADAEIEPSLVEDDAPQVEAELDDVGVDELADAPPEPVGAPTTAASTSPASAAERAAARRRTSASAWARRG